MSNRSILEFNHDFAPRDEELIVWARKIKLYLSSGDPSCLPDGVKWFGIRHHTDPCPLGEGWR